MNKKKIFIIAIAIIAVTLWVVRVYNVNSGVAREYEIKTYQLNEQIPLGNATLKITNYSYGTVEKGNGYKTVPLSVEMKVKNTSNKEISITKLVQVKLAFGRDYYQTRDGEFDVGQLKSLPSNATTKITLKYHVKPKYKGEHPKLYISQHLYEKRVMDKYEKGTRFGIAVDL